MSRPEFPANLEPVKRTRDFTSDDVPKALLKEHVSNKWAKLVVQEGQLTFIEPPNIYDVEEFRVSLAKGDSVHIIPGINHFVSMDNFASFYIEFYDRT